MKDLTFYIKHYKNVLDKKICKEIINQPDLAFYPATISGGKLNNKVRNCYSKKLDKKFDKIFFDAVALIINKYKEDIKNFKGNDSNVEDTGYEHLLYMGSKTGFYTEHIDHSDRHPRVLSISFLLNDNYEGGEFSFFGGEHILPKETGSAIVFPSNFCFPHAVLPVTRGDRHAIITWIR